MQVRQRDRHGWLHKPFFTDTTAHRTSNNNSGQSLYQKRLSLIIRSTVRNFQKRKKSFFAVYNRGFCFESILMEKQVFSLALVMLMVAIIIVITVILPLLCFMCSWRQIWLRRHCHVLQSGVEFEHRLLQLCLQHLSAYPWSSVCNSYVGVIIKQHLSSSKS